MCPEGAILVNACRTTITFKTFFDRAILLPTMKWSTILLISFTIVIAAVIGGFFLVKPAPLKELFAKEGIKVSFVRKKEFVGNGIDIKFYTYSTHGDNEQKVKDLLFRAG
jgi:hypothetical protein